MTNLLKGYSILLVDDDETFRGAIRFELEFVGAIVTEAEGGNPAFEKIKLENFDLVLSDVRMPNGDGFDLLDRIHVAFPSLPVFLFISDLSTISDAELQARGCSGQLAKPFDPEELIKMLANLLENHKK